MKEKIILVGGGGHCKSCIDVIEQEGAYQIAGVVDVPEKLHQKILGYEIIATDDDNFRWPLTVSDCRERGKKILLCR